MACDDLDINLGKRGDLAALAKDYEVIDDFVDAYKSGAQQSGESPIREIRAEITKSKGGATPLPDQMIVRIRFDGKSGAWRSAVWHDREHNVVWLCRCRRISDYSSEEALYEAYGSDYRTDPLRILPSEGERKLAAAIQYRDLVLGEIQRAAEKALSRQDEWIEAEITRPDGRRESVGAVYRWEDSEDGSVMGERFVAVVRKPAVPHTELDGWVALIMKDCSDPRAEVRLHPISQMPAGRKLRPGEIVLGQEIFST